MNDSIMKKRSEKVPSDITHAMVLGTIVGKKDVIEGGGKMSEVLKILFGPQLSKSIKTVINGQSFHLKSSREIISIGPRNSKYPINIRYTGGGIGEIMINKGSFDSIGPVKFVLDNMIQDDSESDYSIIDTPTGLRVGVYCPSAKSFANVVYWTACTLGPGYVNCIQ